MRRKIVLAREDISAPISDAAFRLMAFGELIPSHHVDGDAALLFLRWDRAKYDAARQELRTYHLMLDGPSHA